MSQRFLYSIVESPAHPNFSALYAKLGYTEVRLATQRKAITELKKQPADVIVAEFFYGFGNNYAGVNVSNLDVMLSCLPKYSPDSKIVVLAQKDQLPHVDKLAQLFKLHAVVPLPATADQMMGVLKGL